MVLAQVVPAASNVDGAAVSSTPQAKAVSCHEQLTERWIGVSLSVDDSFELDDC